jgi:hypothetical protein
LLETAGVQLPHLPLLSLLAAAGAWQLSFGRAEERRAE